VREGGEDEGGVAERGGVRRDEADVAPGPPLADAHDRPALVVRRGEGQLERRVAMDEGEQLTTRIAARPQDSDGDAIHDL
jgi:hypothetical protein